MTRSDDDGGVGHDAIDWDRLDRYFAGELPPEEADAVRQWLSADPRRQAFVDTMRQLGTRPPASSYAATAWAGISKQLHRGPFRSVPTARRASHWPHRVTWGVLAAAAVALCIVTLRFSHAFERTRSTWVAGRDYRTAPGQSKTVTLADGTQFTLAPASRVHLGPRYGHARRDVYLDGEAYFAVAHDPRRPFAVHAGQVTATDIGTEFDVRAYSVGGPVQVAVAAGAVAVAHTGAAAATPAVSLRSNDVATVTDRGISIERGADVSTLTTWVSGGLAYGNVAFSDVVPDLERWYDLDIHIVDSSLANRRLTAHLRDGPADDILGALAQTIGASVTRAGRSVTFAPLTR